MHRQVLWLFLRGVQSQSRYCSMVQKQLYGTDLNNSEIASPVLIRLYLDDQLTYVNHRE